MKILPVTLSALEAFGGDLEWVSTNDNWEDLARDKLTNLLEDLVGVQKDNFDFESCYPAYLAFVTFARGKYNQFGKVDLEKVWETFWGNSKDNNSFTNFVELFEFVQIKTYSEAIAETVGSIMNVHQAAGRNLHPVNTNKEIFLRFNLAPLHILKIRFIPEVVEEKVVNEKKSYFNKTQRKDKLKFEFLSASVGNFRGRVESKAHLPIKMFK